MYFRFEIVGHEQGYGIWSGWRTMFNSDQYSMGEYNAIDRAICDLGADLPCAQMNTSIARCWFKGNKAGMWFVRQLRPIVDLLRSCGVHVVELHAEDPGEVVWEDDYQAAIIAADDL